MFTPHRLTIAMLMMITSAVCWGSWANTFKGVRIEVIISRAKLFLVGMFVFYCMAHSAGRESDWLNRFDWLISS
jgi:hypothetical protein